MRIKMSCRECGNNRFDFPKRGSDDAHVTCADCGHLVGTMGSLKQAVATAVATGNPFLKFDEERGTIGGE
jgi:uncharacterized Zn finger protein